MRLYEEMVSRVKHFFKISDYDRSLGRYDIALFHLEQAVQLSLRAYLLKVFGDFPKTYSIKDLIDLSENEYIKKLADELWFVVNRC
jgi:HEPN domain-containing protein